MSKTDSFVATVERFIGQHSLLKPDGHYIVALSGGADSVALLLVLCALGYKTEAAHCNFHLRGEESNRDEAFCKDLCSRLGIPFHLIHFDTSAYATLHKVSIEMAARDLRYGYFAQLSDDLQADGVCVAHHKDDSVETVLINLIRGTGINGLTGIKPRNGLILRPLLCVGRKDILDYLQEKQQPFVTDSSNLIANVVRNKIRLQVLPLLQTISPGAVEGIATTASHLAEANKMLQCVCQDKRLMQTADNKLTKIDKQTLMEKACPEFVLHSLLSPYGFRGDIIKEIIAGRDNVGKRWMSTTHELAVDRDNLLVRPISDDAEKCMSLRLPEAGTYRLTDNRKLILSISARTEDFSPSKALLCITLDADKVQFPLLLRRTSQGDRFQPFGMKGTKLVSDFLTDQKLSPFAKDEQLVLCDASDNIVWIVGLRTSDFCKTTDATSRILKIDYCQE